MEGPQRIKNRITEWPSSSIQDIYLKEMKTLTRKDTCISLFITALFTIAKTWQSPMCPLMDEWKKKMLHTHILAQWNIIIHKKEGNLNICHNIHGPWWHYAEWHKTDNIPHIWNLKQRYREQVGGCHGGGWVVGQMDEGGQKVQTSLYKINRSLGFKRPILTRDRE